MKKKDSLYIFLAFFKKKSLRKSLYTWTKRASAPAYRFKVKSIHYFESKSMLRGVLGVLFAPQNIFVVKSADTYVHLHEFE